MCGAPTVYNVTTRLSQVSPQPPGCVITTIMTGKASVRQFSRPVTASAFLQADRLQDILGSVKGKLLCLSLSDLWAPSPPIIE